MKCIAIDIVLQAGKENGSLYRDRGGLMTRGKGCNTWSVLRHKGAWMLGRCIAIHLGVL